MGSYMLFDKSTLEKTNSMRVVRFIDDKANCMIVCSVRFRDLVSRSPVNRKVSVVVHDCVVLCLNGAD